MWTHLSRKALLVLAVLSGALASSQGSAAVYGLVIGIDDYGGGNDLQGAVADANDVAAALKSAGSTDVTLLLNAEARRERIFAELQSLQKKVTAGDTIVLHYAGHGAQEPLRPGDPDADGDGRNDDFVLGGFLTLNDATERVVDKEVVAWLAETGRSGVKVLFVADSCHSGGMIRATSTNVKTRRLDLNIPNNDSIARNVRSISMSDPGLANVTFLAAVPRNRASPEIKIDGQSRGALSWAFARALEGAAAPSANELTQAQLQRFVVPTVIALSEGQQLPQMFPARGGNFSIMPLASTKAPAALPQQGVVLGTRELGAVRPVTLAITGGEAPAAPPNARIVALNESPELVWDMRSRTISQRVGGIVADNIEAYDIDSIVAKWTALDLVKRAMGATAPEIELVSGLKVYGRSEEVRIRVGGVNQPYLTMFNLPPNGRVELLYPDAGNPSEAGADWRGKTVEQRFFVDRPPFGAEHLVTILSAAPLTKLHAVLARMNDRREAVGLPDVLHEALAQPNTQTGVLPIYTSGK